MKIKTVKPPSADEVVAERKPLRDINAEVVAARTKLDQFAVFITEHVGTMGFFLIIVTWTALWLSWNLLAPKELKFDPPMGFVFWLFISNMIQILLMPLIMVGQNIQGQHAEKRADFELEVNLKSEKEIEVILRHLEYQNSILLKMLENMGTTLDELMETTEAK